MSGHSYPSVIGPRTSGLLILSHKQSGRGLSGHAFHRSNSRLEYYDEWDLEWNGCSLQAVGQSWHVDWIILVLCSLYYRFRTVMRCEMKVLVPYYFVPKSVSVIRCSCNDDGGNHLMQYFLGIVF